MTIADQVLNQAELLTGELDDTGRERLRLLCTAAVRALTAQLRDGLSPEDIREDFVAAASLYALSRWGRGEDIQEFRAGDLTVKKGQVANLEAEALALLGPYLKTGFTFVGV